MALDKVIDSAELDANLTAVADAIRTKGGTSEALSFPDGFISAVEGIQAGGGSGGASEITIATACANARQILDLFQPMSDSDAIANVWAFKGDVGATGVNNHMVYLVLYTYNAIGDNSVGMYVRLRNGGNAVSSTFTTGYDLAVSVGDTYMHWALKF